LNFCLLKWLEKFLKVGTVRYCTVRNLDHYFKVTFDNLIFYKIVGKKLYIWLVIPIIYGLSVITWTKTGAFSGIYFSWFFNPHIGYIDDVNQVTT